MYESHWGFHETPFRAWLDPNCFHQSPTHEEALARLHFLVDGRRRLGLLTGEPGSGKSLLLEVFARQLRHGGRPVAQASLLAVERGALLWQLAAGLGLNLDPTDTVASLWRSLVDRIAEYRYQRLETTLLLDDADQAADQAGGNDVLALVARLARHDLTPESRLTIILAGRRERIARLGEPLLDLAELRIDVEPWEQADTESYIEASLARAGRHEPVFDPKAVARLQELTGGVPRRVSRLADLALLAGAGRDLQQIDAEVVEAVHQELGVAGV
jgi:type II secretory pathway predicted ATPase ExeA